MIWRPVGVVFISGVWGADLQMIDRPWRPAMELGRLDLSETFPRSRRHGSRSFFRAQWNIQVPVRLGSCGNPRLLLRGGTKRFARRTARHSGCTLQKATVYHLRGPFAKASVSMPQAAQRVVGRRVFCRISLHLVGSNTTKSVPTPSNPKHEPRNRQNLGVPGNLGRLYLA